VSNILGKLGVATRGEAAATAHRLHLLDSLDPAEAGPPESKEAPPRIPGRCPIRVALP